MKQLVKILLILLLFPLYLSQCTHPIFCSERILQAIAESKAFPDSKTFVDLVLKVQVTQALKYFQTKSVAEFISLSFHPNPDIIIEKTTFDDFKDNPSFLTKIKDSNTAQFARQLHNRWNQLGKRINAEKIKSIGNCTSLCTSYLDEVLNQDILVPGGRFRQSYYWDTYWIILGLITSDMLDTAEGILDLFSSVINKYGFIPNGLRQYYLNRSQPPFFFLMVKKLSQAYMIKGDLKKSSGLQRKYYPVIVKEHKYWEQTHKIMIQIKGSYFNVSQYSAKTTSARPQSYKEDQQTVRNIPSQIERKRVFKCLSSMAESGWDFSSRWLDDPKDLSSTIIDEIIPTDLNALLGLQQSYLATLSSKYGSESQTIYFIYRLSQRRDFFKLSKKDNRFPDLLINGSYKANSNIVYPTDYLPFLLFSEKTTDSAIFNNLVNPASSTINTGQQWDSPNVWAPNNWILHQISPAVQSYRFAEQWVQTTYCGWRKTGNLYEKYRNDKYGERGQGGQYVVQTGFGWTNGLALHYLGLYGDTLKLKSCK